MKKQFYSFIIALLLGTAAKAQFTAADIQYWLGTGTDTTILVIDFQDGSWDQSYAWGYLHNSNTTAQEMLEAIAAADVNLEISVPGGFISDITYGSHEGIGGTLIEEVAYYWSTWSGTAYDNFEMNGGASEQLTNGSWFGCSFTDFDPALEPSTPIAAFEPFRFTAEDVEFWVGTGDHETIVVIDFQTAEGISSFAWGYRHSGETSGENILNAIDAADDNLELTIDGGFLMDITYNGFAGLFADPNYWSTWSATNLGNWYTNMGVGEVYNDGDILGCSYTDFMPALRPRYPLAASMSVSVANIERNSLQVYPNPATDMLTVNTGKADAQAIRLYNIAGVLVFEKQNTSGIERIDVSTLPSGMYILQAGNMQKKVTVQ